MSFNFPSSPAINDVYPATGTPLYKWNGQQWVALSSGFVPEAPQDGKQYARQNAAWSVVTGGGTSPAALAYSGIQINGSCEISQERGTTTTNTNGNYICDSWRFGASAGYGANGGQVVITPSAALPFNNVVQLNIGTGIASPGTSDFVQCSMPIEGYRIARLGWGTAAAQPITIAFWTNHVRSGLYSVAVRNGALNRSYVATYTQAAASTPQYNVITIPGCTDGVWEATTNTAIYLSFMMSSGSNYITAPGVWTVGSFQAATGQVNGAAATSDIFRITGLNILPGIEAPTAAQSPLIQRPYDQEIQTCFRYLEIWTFANTAGAVIAAGMCTSTTGANFPLAFKVRKRISPAIGYSALTDFQIQIVTTNVACTSMGGTQHDLFAGMISAVVGSGLTAGAVCNLTRANANARVIIDARLT